MRVVTGDGLIARAGGRVVKNVAGYDLCKLHIGAMGTLGVIVEATFKVFPVAQAQECRSFDFDTIQAACDFIWEAQRRRLSLKHTYIRNRLERGEGRFLADTGYSLDIEVAGSSAAVTRSAREIDEMAASGGVPRHAPKEQRSERAPDWVTGKEPLSVRITVPRTKLPDVVHAIAGEATGAVFDPIDPALGEIVAVWLGLTIQEQETLIDRLRTSVKDLGGTIVLTLCAQELKRRIDVFGDPPPSFPLMRAIKQQFDPNGILSPGRFVGRL
jgi:glycolate oxidase FAD binding subunit